jgi:hypothetical protein
MPIYLFREEPGSWGTEITVVEAASEEEARAVAHIRPKQPGERLDDPSKPARIVYAYDYSPDSYPPSSR